MYIKYVYVEISLPSAWAPLSIYQIHEYLSLLYEFNIPELYVQEPYQVRNLVLLPYTIVIWGILVSEPYVYIVCLLQSEKCMLGFPVPKTTRYKGKLIFYALIILLPVHGEFKYFSTYTLLHARNQWEKELQQIIKAYYCTN